MLSFPMELMFGQMERSRKRVKQEPQPVSSPSSSSSSCLLTLARQTGVIKDPYVFSTALSFYHSCTHGQARSRAVAALSLAVDVAGDYEADYARSALAWSVLYEGNECSHPAVMFGKINVACRALMRAKFDLATALHWNLRAVETVAAVARGASVQLIHICALALLPRGVDAATIGALVLLISKGPLAIATPHGRHINRLRRLLTDAKDRAKESKKFEKILANPEMIESILQCSDLFFTTRDETDDVLDRIEEAFEKWSKNL